MDKQCKIIVGTITEIDEENYSCTIESGEKTYQGVELDTIHLEEENKLFRSIIIIPEISSYCVAISYRDDQISLISAKLIDRILIGNKENDFVFTIDIINNTFDLQSGEDININITDSTINITNKNSSAVLENDKITVNSTALELNGNGESAPLGDTISSALASTLGYISDTLGFITSHTHVDPISGLLPINPADIPFITAKQGEVSALQGQESTWKSTKTKLE
jgi:hypothetical protein